MGMIPHTLTTEVFTGNPATVNDPFDATKLNNGARVPLGTILMLLDSSGRRLKYRYVRYNPTAAVGLVANTNVPGVVYWKDNTFTVVTPTMSEGITTTLQSVAGYLLNAAATAGNFVFIQVGGYLKNAVVAAATAIGDSQVGSGATPLISARVAAATAPTSKIVAGVALAAIAGAQADVLVTAEDF